MSLEDKSLALQARHAMARSPLDISMVQVQCSKGNVELVGYVKKPKEFRGEMDLKKELLNLKRLVSAVRGVSSVYADQLRSRDY